MPNEVNNQVQPSGLLSAVSMYLPAFRRAKVVTSNVTQTAYYSVALPTFTLYFVWRRDYLSRLAGE